MQPVLTQVPPKRWRSMIATRIPAAVRRPASGGPDCPVPIMIASNCFVIYHHSVRAMIEPFSNQMPGKPAVRGFLHRPETGARGALVLTHGAGSNCRAPLLVAVAEAFSAAGL